MWRRVGLVWTDVSEERITSIFRAEKSASEESAWEMASHIPEDGILSNSIHWISQGKSRFGEVGVPLPKKMMVRIDQYYKMKVILLCFISKHNNNTIIPNKSNGVLWHVDLLLGNDRERSSYTTTVSE
jgi:hypothetical protein